MMMARVTNVPATMEASIVGTIKHWYDQIAAIMTSEGGRAILRQNICQRLQAGTLDIEWVIQAAMGGHQDADLALRTYAATFADQGRWEELPRQVQGYMVGAMQRAPVTYPRGKNRADTWTRDVGIAVLVDLTAACWSLPETRGRSTQEPSAAYFVTIVLHKHHKLREQQVGRIWREHHKLAAQLTAAVRTRVQFGLSGAF